MFVFLSLSSAHLISFFPLRISVSMPLRMSMAFSSVVTLIVAFSRVSVLADASKTTLPEMPSPVMLPPAAGTAIPLTFAETSSAACAAFGIKHSTIHRISRILSIRFFISRYLLSSIANCIYLQTGRRPALRPPSGLSDNIRSQTLRSGHTPGRI